MKKSILLIAILGLIQITSLYSQMKEFKAGHEYKLMLPDYMKETVGLNSSASIQFKNVVKDVYGFIIDDTKTALTLAEMQFTSVKEFYDDFIKDFAADMVDRKVTEPKETKKNGNNYIESAITYYEPESKVSIYYYVGIVETKNAFYKVLCWCENGKEDKFIEDFKKILFSVKD